MDKSLDEIIGESQPAAASAPQSSSGGVNKRRSRRRNGSSAPTSKPQKTVVIQNLQDNISEDDLRDLFRQVGPVIRVEIQRDGSGNRTGVAWVVYDFAQDALVAAERYNKRKAAGKVITVKRVARVGDTGATQTVSLGDRIGPESGKRQRRRKNAGKAKPAQPSRTRNASDLDAELDAYMQVDSSLPESAPPGTDQAPTEKTEEAMIEV